MWDYFFNQSPFSKQAKKAAVTFFSSELNWAAEVFFPAKAQDGIGMLPGFQQETILKWKNDVLGHFNSLAITF